MIIFNDLLNCMEEISSIYIKLYRLELLGEKNGSYFDNLVNDLKKLLIKEKELFSAFENDSDYGILKSFILDEEGPVFSRLREYINLNEKITKDIIVWQ